jgi:IS4 transposase
MLLGRQFTKFIEASPVCVMVRGTVERIFDPEQLQKVFDDNAVLQYTKEITFGQCVSIMSAVVFQVSPTVGAWLKTHADEVSVTRQAVYDKLKHIELATSAGLVRYSYDELLSAAKAMAVRPKPLLPGYCVRVLDGNHLSGTEHRILETRRHRAAVLPGQALVFYDPQWDLISDVIPCECGHAQERSLTDDILAAVRRKDCVIADRNFCTTRILFGIENAKAFFVIRQHKKNVEWQRKGKVRRVCKDEQGRWIDEQTVVLTDPQSGETLTARRITIHLDKPTKEGEMEIHLLTNLPAKDADALKVASLYADRWTIETAFQHLTVDLRCEINTLGYPKAALFGFCVALLAYNAVSLVKTAMRAAHGKEFVEEELSMYYLTLEVAQVSTGMNIAIERKDWAIFRTMTAEEFGVTMVELARHMKLNKYTKHKRGPKKPQPKKLSGEKIKHLSTAKLLAARA